MYVPDYLDFSNYFEDITAAAGDHDLPLPERKQLHEIVKDVTTSQMTRAPCSHVKFKESTTDGLFEFGFSAADQHFGCFSTPVGHKCNTRRKEYLNWLPPVLLYA